MSNLYARIDVALARDPDLMGHPMARLFYIQAFCYCRENLTDGEIDSRLLPIIAPDIPQVPKQIKHLVSVGKLIPCDCGWVIPERVYRRFNPLRSEVDDARQADAKRKRSYRESHRTNGSVPAGHEADS